MNAIARFAIRHHKAAIAISLAIAAVLYFGIMTRGAFNLSHKTAAPLAFNSMLQHMLQGRFDVDPDAIGHEGFLVKGKVYSYFGIFPALFRLIFAPFVDLNNAKLTIISCLVADLIAVGAQLALVFRIVRQGAGTYGAAIILPLWIVTLFSGPQFMFLRPSVYQEPVFWSLAFAYTFIYLAVDVVLLGRRLTVPLMSAMAAFAGLTLLTRVSTAVALYGAMGIVLFYFLAGCLPGEASWWARIKRAAIPLALPAGILVIFAVAAGYVNYQRFGSPLKFLDLHYQIVSLVDDPVRLARVDSYGEFNVARIGYALLYYFVPVWMIRQAEGSLIFPEFRHRYFDMVELPPSSFFLSDPLILSLGALVILDVFSLKRRRTGIREAAVIAVAAMLALPAVIELCAISLSFRYRGDFYPFLLFMAAAGLWSLLSQPPSSAGRWLALRGAWPLAFVSVLASTLFLGLYFLSPFGDGEQCVKQGWVACYESRLKPAPTSEDETVTYPKP